MKEAAATNLGNTLIVRDIFTGRFVVPYYLPYQASPQRAHNHWHRNLSCVRWRQHLDARRGAVTGGVTGQARPSTRARRFFWYLANIYWVKTNDVTLAQPNHGTIAANYFSSTKI